MLDSALERSFGAVSRPGQMQALGEVVHHMTDQLNVLGLIHDKGPTLMANRLRNVEVAQTGRAAIRSSAHEWDVQLAMNL